MNNLPKDIGVHREDLSGEGFNVYNCRYNPNYTFVIPKEEVDFSTKEMRESYLRDIGYEGVFSILLRTGNILQVFKMERLEEVVQSLNLQS